MGDARDRDRLGGHGVTFERGARQHALHGTSAEQKRRLGVPEPARRLTAARTT
ncbi:hypothetical protein [Streptomyces mirabilis]